MSNLELAIEIAVKYHSGQKDKANKPYILHPLRVMLKMNTNEEMIVGVLHDIVEDTEYSFEKLNSDGFSVNIIKAIRLLTKTNTVNFDIIAYYQNIYENPLARKVKLADLEDNMDLARISSPTEADIKRIKKYNSYYQYLKSGDVSSLM